MTTVHDMVDYVRSKNAGPFWLTIDLFCGSTHAFEQICRRLKTKQIADLFEIDPNKVKRFDMVSLNVVKFSLPRPTTQGSVKDRDMHGASWGTLVGELLIE